MALVQDRYWIFYSLISLLIFKFIKYPLDARRMGAQGTVGVIVAITRDGNMVRPFIPKMEISHLIMKPLESFRSLKVIGYPFY